MNSMPRFLCDEMLGRLCRYLRAAGYDALLSAGGHNDSELLQQCHAEGRYFLTQDQLVREHKAAHGVALILPHCDLDRLAALVTEHFALNWLSHAFTRCLLDNTPLVTADDTMLQRAPPDVIKPGEPLYHCPSCGRVYWRGSHYKRMHARLNQWQYTKIDPAGPFALVA